MDLDDLIALRSLNGGNLLREACAFRHFFYVDEVQTAEQLAETLRPDGFDVEIRPAADGGGWLVLARHELIPSDETVETLRTRFELLAAEAGGEYDGWEAEKTRGH